MTSSGNGAGPNFGPGDKVAGLSRIDNEVYIVCSEPRQANGTWYMLVRQQGFSKERLRKCSEFILTHKHQPLVRIKLTIKSENIKKEFKKMKLTKPALVTLFIGLLFFMIGASVLGNFNQRVAERGNVREAKAQIDTQEQRRFDLVQNLVNTVKGSAAHESKAIKDVADARKTYQGASSTEDKEKASQQVSTTIANLQKLQEAYPDLKANAQFGDTMKELTATEEKMATARDNYNKLAKDFNVKIEQFPNSLLAGMFGFDEFKLFESNKKADTAPVVNFN